MKRPATCHPEREHLARGLCRSCYRSAYRRSDLAASREREREANKRFRAAHPEYAKEYQRQKFAANPSMHKDYRASRIDIARAQGRAKSARRRERGRQKSYRLENIEKWRLYGRLYQAARRAVMSRGPGVSRDEWQGIVEQFGGACAYCLEPASTIDHVEALARGGLHEPSNVVPACKSCNSRKRDSSLLRWMLRGGGPNARVDGE